MTCIGTVEGLHDLYNFGDVSILGSTCRASEHLNFTLRNFLANSHSERDSHEIRVLEFHAGALVTIVEHYVVPGLLELPRQLVGGLCYQFVLHVRGHYYNLERRNVRWQPEPVVVMILFDRRGQDALYTDAVAPHDRRHFL